jgi:hypothetical protein
VYAILLADVTVTQLRPHVTDSNDAVLSEAGRTMAVFGGGASETRFCAGTQLWNTSSWSCRSRSVSGSGLV